MARKFKELLDAMPADRRARIEAKVARELAKTPPRASATWYATAATRIADRSGSDGGADELHARETPDGWEYAIVERRGHVRRLWLTFRNGVVTIDP